MPATLTTPFPNYSPTSPGCIRVPQARAIDRVRPRGPREDLL
ncbi:MAG: hypothetical protein M0038_18040 [Pseudomonadota bacterium]|nr:hypothetical protein [Pseudomonadota bacterium]